MGATIEPLVDVLRQASYPAGGPSLLGALYEQLLGVALHRDADNRVHHQTDRSTSRAHGVTYTPAAVTRYMVEHSVGTLLQRRPITDPSSAPLRIVDPACGAGAFLLAAFDQLQSAYLDNAERFEPAQRDRLFRWTDQGARPTRFLNEHIAQAHLFGMDRDEDALQVARHALRWRMAADTPEPSEPEGCSAWVDNLICCDTLRPSDARTVPFIAGGFDVCIGNPPYVFGEWIDGQDRARYAEHLSLARTGQPDLFKLFYERSVRDLLLPDGLHAFVVPDALLARDEHRDLRRWLTEHLDMLRICHAGQVFQTIPLGKAGRLDAPRRLGVSCVITIGQRKGPTTRPAESIRIDRWQKGQARPGHTLPLPAITGTDGAPWAIHAPARWFGPAGLHEIMRCTGCTLQDLLQPGPAGITRGEELGKRALARNDERFADNQTPVLVGSDIQRHHCGVPSRTVQPHAITKRPAFYTGPKILVVKTGASVVAATSRDATPVLQSIYSIHLSEQAQTCWDEDAVVGILCSAWVSAWAWYTWTSGKKQQPQLTIGNVKSIPLPANPDPTELRRIQASVQTLAGLLAAPAADTGMLDQRLAETELALDTAVGALYGLKLGGWLDVLTPALSRLPRSQRPRWFVPSSEEA